MEIPEWQQKKLMKLAKMLVVLKRTSWWSDLGDIGGVCIHVDTSASLRLPFHWELVEDVEIKEIVLRMV